MRQFIAPSLTLALVLSSLLVDVRPGQAAPQSAGGNTEPAAAAPSMPVPMPLAPIQPKGLPAPWKDMTAKQRGTYMKKVVNPQMKVLFQAFDPVAFKRFDCSTCHGKDPMERKFKMPSGEIHPLPATPAAFKAMMKEKPTWPAFAQFMGEKVEPQMAALLGLVPFDPKTPQAGGFGCRGCHTISKS